MLRLKRVICVISLSKEPLTFQENRNSPLFWPFPSLALPMHLDPEDPLRPAVVPGQFSFAPWYLWPGEEGSF